MKLFGLAKLILSENGVRILSRLNQKPATVKVLVRQTGVPVAAAYRLINKFLTLGLVEKVGALPISSNGRTTAVYASCVKGITMFADHQKLVVSIVFTNGLTVSETYAAEQLPLPPRLIRVLNFTEAGQGAET